MSKRLLLGKNAIITGTARGMGNKMMEVFAENGANIWACARKKNEKLEAQAKELSEKHGVEITIIYFEMTNLDEMKAAVKQIMQAKKPIDVLVNNAGITRDNLVMKMNDEEFDAVYETNLKGVFHTLHHGRESSDPPTDAQHREEGAAHWSISNPGWFGFGESRNSRYWCVSTITHDHDLCSR